MLWGPKSVYTFQGSLGKFNRNIIEIDFLSCMVSVTVCHPIDSWKEMPADYWSPCALKDWDFMPHSTHYGTTIASCHVFLLFNSFSLCVRVCVSLLPFTCGCVQLPSPTSDKSHLTCAIIVVYSSLVPPVRTPALVFPFNHEFQFRSCSSLLRCRPLRR